MDDPDHLWGPAPAYARPVGLGSLGSESYFLEPYRICSPHRIHVGDGVGIGARAFLSVVESYADVEREPSLRIGDRVVIGSDAFIHCGGEVIIEDNAGLSVRVFIGDSGRDLGQLGDEPEDLPIEEPSPVRICEYAVLGVGAQILQGVTVGKRAFVGAGSVVTRDVPPYSVVFGNPARVVRRWDKEAGTWKIGR
jgi:acetyltransferase-like isoleucine patch superfamily enzyme